jgi:hypothetical protein
LLHDTGDTFCLSRVQFQRARMLWKQG